MARALPLALSTLLHGAVVLVLYGAAPSAAEESRAIIVGSTFEVEALFGAPILRQAAPPTLPATTPPPAGPTPAELPAPEPAEPPPEPATAPPPRTEPDTSVPLPKTPPAPKPESPLTAAADSSPTPAPKPAPPASAASPTPASAPSANPAQTASDAPSAPSDAGSVNGTPTYGEEAPRPLLVSLAKAFTRAMPRAAHRNKAWHGLPPGDAGVARFVLSLGEAGRGVEFQMERIDNQTAPAHLVSVVRITSLMLGAGQYAISSTSSGAAEQRFELSAHIDLNGAVDDVGEPTDLQQIGRHVEPTLGRPGMADFTFNSGRHVELRIKLIPH